MWKQCIEMYEILDSAYVNGQQLVELLRARGADNVEMETLVQGERHTDFLRIVIAGESGKNRGLTSPTISLIGRLGGLGARPDAVGFVSDGDGALCVLSVALKLLAMIKQGDRLQGDVVISTHICPNAPTVEHIPVRMMGSPVDDGRLTSLETAYPADAILSVDTTKGNRILCQRGFAITPTVKEGYILRVSESLLNIMCRTTGKLPVVLPITMQDITPYGNGVFHLNSIMQPSTGTKAPTVGVAITTEVPIAGCATGATNLADVESAARFILEVAKAFTAGDCTFFDEAEFLHLRSLYGEMTRLQGK